jgi:hypothetical protein
MRVKPLFLRPTVAQRAMIDHAFERHGNGRSRNQFALEFLLHAIAIADAEYDARKYYRENPIPIDEPALVVAERNRCV